MCELLQISKIEGTESPAFKCSVGNGLSSSDGLKYNGLGHKTEARDCLHSYNPCFEDIIFIYCIYLFVLQKNIDMVVKEL